MSMNGNELMIGDWVKINDVDYTTPVQIDCIVKKHGTVYAYFAEFDIRVACEKLQGIPLTADLLGKNGFYPLYDDKSAYKLFWSDEKEEIYWSITIDLTHPIASRIENHIMRTGRKTENWEMKGCVYFVHELQHLMRQFRIDKEIVN